MDPLRGGCHSTVFSLGFRQSACARSSRFGPGWPKAPAKCVSVRASQRQRRGCSVQGHWIHSGDPATRGTSPPDDPQACIPSGKDGRLRTPDGDVRSQPLERPLSPALRRPPPAADHSFSGQGGRRLRLCAAQAPKAQAPTTHAPSPALSGTPTSHSLRLISADNLPIRPHPLLSLSSTTRTHRLPPHTRPLPTFPIPPTPLPPHTPPSRRHGLLHGLRPDRRGHGARHQLLHVRCPGWAAGDRRPGGWPSLPLPRAGEVDHLHGVDGGAHGGDRCVGAAPQGGGSGR